MHRTISTSSTLGSTSTSTARINTAQEVNTRERAAGPGEPAWQRLLRRSRRRLLKESTAQRNTNPLSARFWRVVNRVPQERLGQPVAYRLCPGENVLPFAQPDAAVLEAGGLPDQEPLGDAVSTRASVIRPAIIPTRTPAATACPAGRKSRPQHRGDRPGRLVHLRPDPHSPHRGLAGDAGQLASASCSGRTASSTPTRRSICRRRGVTKTARLKAGQAKARHLMLKYRLGV